MSQHKYKLRSTQTSPSSSSAHEDEEVSSGIDTNNSTSADTPINGDQLPVLPVASLFFTGYIPVFRTVYSMSDAHPDHLKAKQLVDADQIDVIGSSQDHLDLLPAQFQNAQDLPSEHEDKEHL